MPNLTSHSLNNCIHMSLSPAPEPIFPIIAGPSIFFSYCFMRSFVLLFLGDRLSLSVSYMFVAAHHNPFLPLFILFIPLTSEIDSSSTHTRTHKRERSFRLIFLGFIKVFLVHKTRIIPPIADPSHRFTAVISLLFPAFDLGSSRRHLCTSPMSTLLLLYGL